MPRNNLYDPSGCLRMKRKQDKANGRILNIAVGTLFVLIVLGAAWLCTVTFPVIHQ